MNMEKRNFWQCNWRWLWSLAFIGGLVFTRREVQTQLLNPVDLTTIHRPLVAIILGVVLLPWVLRKFSILNSNFLIPFFIFSIWRMLTSFWSIYPLWSLYRSIEYFEFLALTAFTVWSFNDFKTLRKWIDWIWIYLGMLNFTVWIGLIIQPNKALVPIYRDSLIPYMLKGIFPAINPNSVSHIGGILALIGLCRMLESKKAKWFFLILWGIATMILSQGRSGMVGFLVGFIIVLILSKRINIFIGTVIMIGFLIFYTDAIPFLWKFFRRGQSLELFFTLSDRINVWKFAWEYVKEKPIGGWGAFAGDRFLVSPKIFGKFASSAHNSWMNLLVNTGFIGTILFSIGIFRLFFGGIYEYLKLREKDLKIEVLEMIGILSLLLVRGFFTDILAVHNQFAFLGTLGVFEFTRRKRIKDSKIRRR